VARSARRISVAVLVSMDWKQSLTHRFVVRNARRCSPGAKAGSPKERMKEITAHVRVLLNHESVADGR
jgi:hypothetical protein